MKKLVGFALGAALLAMPLVAGAQIAPPTPLGSVTLRGLITAQGRLTFGNGVISIGIKEVGDYRLTLNHNVSQCTFSVNVQGSTPGYATVNYTAKDTTLSKVDVFVFDQSGAPAALPFFFNAQCPA